MSTPTLTKPAAPAGTAIRRGFVDVKDGQMHYRVFGTPGTGANPLILLHAQPAASSGMQGMMRRLGPTRVCYAPDTLGSGFSCPALMEEPDAAYLGMAVVEAADAWGLGKFDLYGTHTGASLAIEIAIAHPERVGKMVLNGVVFYSDSERKERLDNYTPVQEPRPDGTHLIWAWNFMRDMNIFHPWYMRDGAHRKDGFGSFPSASDMHERVLDILNSIRTYHKAYRAAFRHDTPSRLPLVKVPTLLASPPSDSLFAYNEAVAKLIPDCRFATLPATGKPEDMVRTTEVITEFLDS